MADNCRIPTDRFFGGFDRLQSFQEMLIYIRDGQSPREGPTQWVIDHTDAGSPDAISHHLTFLDSIELIELSEKACEL
jgi:hypothetical protein